MTNEVATQQTQPMTKEDIMIEILETQKEHNATLEDHSEQIDYLKNEQPINREVNYHLSKRRNKVIIGFLGGKDSPAYQDAEFRASVYKEYERDFKDYFKIRAYGDLPKKDAQRAIDYCDEWEPSTNTKRHIRYLNEQPVAHIKE